jgi:hypothetical protein
MSRKAPSPSPRECENTGDLDGGVGEWSMYDGGEVRRLAHFVVEDR